MDTANEVKLREALKNLLDHADTVDHARKVLAETEPEHPAVEMARWAYGRYAPNMGQGTGIYFYDGYYRGFKDGMLHCADLPTLQGPKAGQIIRDAASKVPLA